MFGSTDGPIVVLFTAPTWCVPCRRFESHWTKATGIAEDHTFIKIDMGASPEDTGTHWASAKFGIMGVPKVIMWSRDESDSVFDIQARALVPFLKEIGHDG